MKKTVQRESGIELLRILSACAVVLLHYYNAKLGGAQEVIYGSRKIFMDLLVSFSCCAVNVFILISGYFLSNKQSRSIGKPFSLYFQVVLLSLIGYGIELLLKEATFNPLHIVLNFVPHNYFVLIYTALYFISPIINKFLLSLDKDYYKKILIVFFVLFSVYNFCIDLLADLTGREMIGRNTIGQWGTQYGYTIVNFILLYCIGGYLKLYGFPRIIKDRAFVMAIICTIVIFGLRYLVKGGMSAASYLNPIVILLAMCVFSLFVDTKWKSRIINELSGAAFTCFPLHLIVIGHIGIKTYAAGTTFQFILHLVLSIVLIYIAAYVFYKLYNLIFSRLIQYLDRFSLSFDKGPLIVKK